MKDRELHLAQTIEEMAKKDKEYSKLLNTYTDLEANALNMSEKLETKEVEIGNLHEVLENEEKVAECHKQDKEKAQTYADQLKTSVDQLKGELNGQDLRLQIYEHDLQLVSGENQGHETAVKHMESTIDDLREKIKKLEESAEKNKVKLQRQKTAYDAAMKQLSKAKKEVYEANQQTQNWKKEAKELNTSFNESENRLADIFLQQLEIQNSRTSVNTQTDESDSDISSYEKADNNLRKLCDGKIPPNPEAPIIQNREEWVPMQDMPQQPWPEDTKTTDNHAKVGKQ